MPNLNHLNPKKITVFKTRDVTSLKDLELVEKPFKILDWVSPCLIKEFGSELILLALTTLGLTFDDLTTSNTISGIGNNFFILKQYPILDVSFITSESKMIDKQFRSYVKYHIDVPSNLKDGDIIQFCLLHKYPFLKDFTHTEIIQVDKEDLQTKHIKIKNIEPELRGLTINELLAIDKPIVINRTVSSVTCYSQHNDNLDNYEFYLHVSPSNDNESLYIPYLALKTKNYQLIEERMIKYFTDYHKNDAVKLKKSLALLKSKRAKMLQKYLK